MRSKLPNWNMHSILGWPQYGLIHQIQKLYYRSKIWGENPERYITQYKKNKKSVQNKLKNDPEKKWIMVQLFSTLIIRGNVSWAPNQYIRSISESSCATEDWRNDCWKLIIGIFQKHVKNLPTFKYCA